VWNSADRCRLRRGCRVNIGGVEVTGTADPCRVML
jgi:hypothetical protein